MQTPLGLISSAWTKDSGRVNLQITVPPNSNAVVELPAGCENWTESTHTLASAPGIRSLDNGTLQVGSGSYYFDGVCSSVPQ
jgi:hypothetical protein